MPDLTRNLEARFSYDAAHLKMIKRIFEDNGRILMIFLRIKILFFNLYDVMKTEVGAKILIYTCYF